MNILQNDKLPSVGVLMVNYNQWELTHKCIQSVLESRGVTIVIGLVDNNSTESAPEWVENTPEIIFYRNSINSGFIAGNIKAYEMVSAQDVDFVILLNNDTEVESDALSLLVEHFITNEDTGLVTPAIAYAENRDILWHAGGSFIPWKMAVKQLFQNTSDLPEKAVEVDQISGCAMMMRTEMFKKIGYQNPGLFIYHEDVEQSLRSHQMGLRNYLVPKARIVHHVSITVGGVLSPFAVYFTHRNRYIFASRNLKGLHLLLFRIYYMAVTMAKTVIYPLRNKGKLVYWMWLGLIHGVKNRPDYRPAGLFPSKETR
jgi:GT2 family glycosyltransferase